MSKRTPTDVAAQTAQSGEGPLLDDELDALLPSVGFTTLAPPSELARPAAVPASESEGTALKKPRGEESVEGTIQIAENSERDDKTG